MKFTKKRNQPQTSISVHKRTRWVVLNNIINIYRWEIQLLTITMVYILRRKYFVDYEKNKVAVRPCYT